MLIHIVITIAVFAPGYLAFLEPSWKGEHGWGWYSVSLLCGAGYVPLSLPTRLPVFRFWIVATDSYALWRDAITSLQAGVWRIALGYDGIRKGLRTLLVHKQTLNFRGNFEGYDMELGMDISDAPLEEMHKVIPDELKR